MAELLERNLAQAPPTAAVVWSERRTRPLLAFYGVPTAFLAIMAVAVPGWALHVLLAVAAVGFATLGLRARRTAVMESYAVTEEEVRVDRPGQPGEAVPLRAVEKATMVGDKVHFDTGEGRALTMSFVRHQRSLIRTLERVAPTVVIDRKLDAFCRT
jgi:hypothetical protein